MTNDEAPEKGGDSSRNLTGLFETSQQHRHRKIYSQSSQSQSTSTNPENDNEVGSLSPKRKRRRRSSLAELGRLVRGSDPVPMGDSSAVAELLEPAVSENTEQDHNAVPPEIIEVEIRLDSLGGEGGNMIYPIPTDTVPAAPVDQDYQGAAAEDLSADDEVIPVDTGSGSEQPELIRSSRSINLRTRDRGDSRSLARDRRAYQKRIEMPRTSSYSPIDLTDDGMDFAEVIDIADDEEDGILTTKQLKNDAPTELNERAGFRQATCCVCFESPKIVAITVCGHFYCSKCVFRALTISPRATTTYGECSVCRTKMAYTAVKFLELKLRPRKRELSKNDAPVLPENTSTPVVATDLE
ncbi:SUMO-targeted ubiquitin ligase complex subunit SLX8 [Sugiyamaella lignohabitans]|uniref:SUMO-targeted ubiquitin ligase complex subunit SLX8 n=1 Tax=Sugiyamaella lignohabitans TaxID=796027 RepID=A0A167EK48_9ASCO|nr:SUMO-targeted ubiquitin ligase complex subunit SLX8 [Sugiyamaella lignohabitans]ANB14171.1 SUMO-targeted ubiquitin ligase complex subunit SLX8 [Sugiyamaella lignohabitans]